jgi:eukaryotic-like serine/threonine-protein kinase
MSKPLDNDPSGKGGGQTRQLGSAGHGVIIKSESEEGLPAISPSNQSSISNVDTVKINKEELTIPQNEAETRANRPADTKAERERGPGGLIPGELFQGKYEIIEMLGAGGMGQVYQAHHLDLGTMVAIKVLNKNLTMDDQAIERFKREARASAKVVHPNAVRVFDYGVEDGTCYLVMEYMEGESLRKRLNKRKRLPLQEVITFTEQVCYVLEVMHRKGITHRDLKPDNIYFNLQEESEVVKVLDFGLAKMSNSATQMAAQLTNPGSIVGTPHYMSPEQCQSIEIDGRSDLYSLGIIVYEMLSGRVPFDAENSYSLLFKQVNDPPPPLQDLASDIPPNVCKVVEKLLEKEPADRYQTAKQFLQALCGAASLSHSFYLDLMDRSRPDNKFFEAGRTGEVSVERGKIDSKSIEKIEKIEKIEENRPTSPLKYILGAAGLVVVIAVMVLLVSRAGMALPDENFVLIQGGSVTIGRNAEDCQAIPGCVIDAEESPAHNVTLSPYYLSKHEVTNKEYKEFVVATNRPAPKLWKGQDFLPGTDDLPVTNITWDDAVAYCKWLSKPGGIEYRLPTEEEWEHAAKGNDNRLYPWGVNWDQSLANANKLGSNSPLRVNQAPNNTEDRSPFGIFAMAGNVSEWTNSNFTVYPGSSYQPQGSDLQCKVFRGGSFQIKSEGLRTTIRAWQAQTYSAIDLGFRLAATPPKK